MCQETFREASATEADTGAWIPGPDEEGSATVEGSDEAPIGTKI